MNMVSYAIYHPEIKKCLDLNQINKALHFKKLNSLLHFTHSDSELLISRLNLAYSRPKVDIDDHINILKPRLDIALFKNDFIPPYESLKLLMYSSELSCQPHKVTKTILDVIDLPLYQPVYLYFLMAQFFDHEKTCTNLKLISPLSTIESVANEYQINPTQYKVIQATRYMTKPSDFIDPRQPKPFFCWYEEKFITASSLIK